MNKANSLSPDQRLIVALDVPTISEAYQLFTKLRPVVSTFKIGYWLLFDPGLYPLLREIRMRHKHIFLDAKLNDIPETVKHGVKSAVSSGAAFVTVHSDATMLEAAMEGKGQSAINVMAVTALTSQLATASRSNFRAGVINAMIAGCDGMIMSPSDLTDAMQVRDRTKNMLIATPGVRMPGTSMNDHGRTGTPSAAIEHGADYIIVGRPIIRADDPLAAAEHYIAELSLGNKTDSVPLQQQPPLWQETAKRLVAAGRIEQQVSENHATETTTDDSDPCPDVQSASTD